MTEAGRTRETSLRVASFPHFSYLPQFVAQARGFFAEEGLEITLVTHAGQWSRLIEAVGDGAADIIVGNMWFALQQARQPNTLLPVAHCLQHTRFMLYRQPGHAGEPFEWAQLEGASVIIPTDVPTPWMAFRQALSVQGVSLDHVRAVVGYSGREAAEDLASGEADFAVLDLDRGVIDGAEEVASLAGVIGPVPWSAFFASRADVEARPEPYRRFQRAINRSLAWIYEHDSASLAALVAPWFPSVDADTATRIIERYKLLEGWPVSADVQPEHVERWLDMLVRWGLMPALVSWQHLLSFAGPANSAGDE